MTSIVDLGDLANSSVQAKIRLDMAIAGATLEAVRKLRIQERKALLAGKPKRQFQSDGYYDPQSPWLFKRKDGHIVTDEPLRDFHAQLHRLDIAIKGVL